MLFFSASHTLSPSLYSGRGLFLYSKWENKWIIISRPPERPISFTVHFVRNILWGLKHFFFVLSFGFILLFLFWLFLSCPVFTFLSQSCTLIVCVCLRENIAQRIVRGTVRPFEFGCTVINKKKRQCFCKMGKIRKKNANHKECDCMWTFSRSLTIDFSFGWKPKYGCFFFLSHPRGKCVLDVLKQATNVSSVV